MYKVNVAANPQTPDERPQYGQLYYVDTSVTGDEATQHRLNEPFNHGMEKPVTQEIETMMRTVNPFAKAYQMLREVEEQDPAQEVALHFVTNKSDTRKLERLRYTKPETANEVKIF